MQDLFLAAIEVELCWMTLNVVGALHQPCPELAEVYPLPALLYAVASLALLITHWLVETDPYFGD